MTTCKQKFIFILAAVALAIVALMPEAHAQTPAASAKAPAATATAAPLLTLSEYLGSVESKNEALKSAIASSEGSATRAVEGDLVTSPSIFGSYQERDDKSFQPALQASGVNTTNSLLGIESTTSFGTNAKLYYSLGSFDIPSRNLKYFQASPTIEISQSLWRNAFGSETRAQMEAVTSGAKARGYAERFRAQTILLQAESTYWGLALARETVAVQRELLDRAERLYTFINRRARFGLQDKAELLQAQANLQARKLDLQTAIDGERAAMRAFNSARGQDANIVEEKLEPLNLAMIERLKVPEGRTNRADVLAAEEQAKATLASSKLNRNKAKPTVELFGSYGLNGLDFASQSEAIDKSFTGDNPTLAYGLRFRASLDIGSISKLRSAYDQEEYAATLAYQRKKFEQERDWDDLTQKFNESKERFKLYNELEESQRKKLDYERDRHARGRSTTQQILLYELDYQQALFGRIRTLADLMQLNAQLKLYGVSNESR